MPQYTPPFNDIQFVLHDLLQVERGLKSIPAHADLDAITLDAILEEAGKFASEVVFPLNQVGDREGCTFKDGVVTTPTGFKEAYRRYVETGWPSLSCDPEYGGQGLPELVNTAVMEMFNSANQAWTMYPGLSHGAYEALIAHGTPEQKQVYLPRLVAGEWTGTMCLTEAHCGTDLGLVKTRAVADPGGGYRLTGTKIFISAGEHDMAENIVHLVLARLPDAPPGTKGISMFVVPKFIPDAAGRVGERNAVQCGSIEHKMGIHGNATCVINLDGAQGWMVGEPNRGLNAMFVMMNGARIGVGMQSLGLAEAAYQNARAYARERLQMRSLSGPKAPDKPADPIIVHPDVRRMLLTQKAYIEAARAFTYWIGLNIDIEQRHPDEQARREAADLVSLLTPVLKGFITDNGYESTTLAMQVFGGHGYITENGMEQFVRDARINMIYEGTNTVQALDLLARKVLADQGRKLIKLGGLIQGFIQAQSERPAMREFVDPLAELLGEVHKLTVEIGRKAMQDPEEVGAAATPFLRVIGHVVFAWFWARMARVAMDRIEAGEADPVYRSKLATARFYYARLLPEAQFRIREIRTGAGSLMALEEREF